MMIVLAVVFGVGATVQHITQIPWYVSVGVTFVILIWCFVSLRTLRSCVYVGSMCAFAVLAMVLVERYENVRTPEKMFGNRVIEGVVVSVHQRLTDAVIVVKDTVYNRNIQFVVSYSEQFLPADTVTVKGNVVAPKDFITETGRIVSYSNLLRAREIFALIEKPLIVSHSSFFDQQKKSAWYKTFFQYGISRGATIIRNSVAVTISRYVSFPFDGIMAGMIIGYQGGIPDTVVELFRITGVLHVLVLSGYNVTLCAGMILSLLFFLPLRIRSVCSGLFVFILVCVSGAGIAAVRAGSMAIISIIALFKIKKYHPLSALALVFIFCVAFSPGQLFYDPGFHLSFLATFFMIVILPHVQRYVASVIRTPSWNELFSVVIGAPLFMFPYTMYFSGSVSISLFFANMLFAWITSPLVIAGIGMVLSSSIPFLGMVSVFIGLVCSVCGTVLLSFLTLISRMPTFTTPPLVWWGSVGMYCIVIFLLERKTIMHFLQQQQQNFFQPHSNLSVPKIQ